MTNSGKIKLLGLGVSPGVAIGHARLFHVSTLDVGESTVLKPNIESEVRRFLDAIETTRNQLQEMGKRVNARGEDKALGDILSMHLLLLKDSMLVDRTAQLIREERHGAEYALSLVVRESRKRYAHLPDLFRERFKDVEDICRRIMDALRGVQTQSLEDLEEESVIVAKDLSPSDTASMRKEKVLGFVTEAGGKTSHTAILARALEIPAIVGVHHISQFAHENNLVILDGHSGVVIVNPSEDDLRDYRAKLNLFQVRQSRLIDIGRLEPITLDGYYIDLAANIEFASECAAIDKYGARGVGLYRTEYLFLNRVAIPTEEEQYQDYRQVAETLAPDPVIIRTLDIGGDKFAHALNASDELNPYLGCRAIRFSLENRQIFCTQLRAILRASASKNLRVMYPLISGPSELKEANDLVAQMKEELRKEGKVFDEKIPIGAMIEVPSAVMVARDLAPQLDFFSIGTNDLIQYALAVDRGNEKIAHLYQPLHPAVLRMISMVVKAGREFNLPVDVCGEMASDPVCVLMLLAIGIERLSMAPTSIPAIKQVVRSVRMDALREFGAHVLELPSVEKVKRALADALRSLLPDRDDLIAELHESNILASV
ncbi:MAG: phosphoenolpyruvate--protein phosphotransferase [Candidatus Omnitrophota bacterium]